MLNLSPEREFPPLDDDPSETGYSAIDQVNLMNDTIDTNARLAASELHGHLSETVSRVAYGHERVILERYGKDLIALVPIEDLRLLEALEDKVDLDAARAALMEARAGNTTTLEDLKAELGL